MFGHWFCLFHILGFVFNFAVIRTKSSWPNPTLSHFPLKNQTEHSFFPFVFGPKMTPRQFGQIQKHPSAHLVFIPHPSASIHPPHFSPSVLPSSSALSLYSSLPAGSPPFTMTCFGTFCFVAIWTCGNYFLFWTPLPSPDFPQYAFMILVALFGIFIFALWDIKIFLSLWHNSNWLHTQLRFHSLPLTSFLNLDSDPFRPPDSADPSEHVRPSPLVVLPLLLSAGLLILLLFLLSFILFFPRGLGSARLPLLRL